MSQINESRLLDYAELRGGLSWVGGYHASIKQRRITEEINTNMS